MPTIADTLTAASRRLTAKHETARLDAEILLCHVVAKPRSFVYAWPDHPLNHEEALAFERLVARRAAGAPVAYLVGRKDFWSLTLAVSDDTLVPRPETERLVELALEHIPGDTGWSILDLGTGTGAITLALALERPRCSVLATDRSTAALRLAAGNGRRLGLSNVTFLGADWCAGLRPGSFDLVACNPPYVADDDPHLLAGDVRHEPREALRGGADGLDPIRRIVLQAHEVLRAGGWLLLEHGYSQGEAVRQLLVGQGYSEVTTVRDLAGHERVTQGQV
jgi:release factor glutamine methyltransferase